MIPYFDAVQNKGSDASGKLLLQILAGHNWISLGRKVRFIISQHALCSLISSSSEILKEGQSKLMLLNPSLSCKPVRKETKYRCPLIFDCSSLSWAGWLQNPRKDLYHKPHSAWKFFKSIEICYLRRIRLMHLWKFQQTLWNLSQGQSGKERDWICFRPCFLI